MLTVRLAEERGHFRNHWLNSYHSFSFGEYYDPRHMGVSALRVINDDHIAAGAGFPTHSHKNIEIVTYVLEGALAHRDNLGNGSIIRAGDVQHLSAGSGITHVEFNPLKQQETHILQIWLLPTERNVKPRYAQQHFSNAVKREQWCLLVSPEGKYGSLTAPTEALIYATILPAEKVQYYRLATRRMAYMHVARGSMEFNGKLFKAGDAAQVSAGTSFHIKGLDGEQETEVLLFDLPAVY
ncbi:pirin family protein [Thiolinea disciformis]|uniref:pirin family protein n=1 Tax=Thiolinea disciformis TaxID=125614 RepID=UPI00036FB887|nr:pirin family protein [Thiolinea disciformis]